jgi:hypothetical protein
MFDNLTPAQTVNSPNFMKNKGLVSRNNRPVELTLNQLNQIHTLTPHFCKITF